MLGLLLVTLGSVQTFEYNNVYTNNVTEINLTPPPGARFAQIVIEHDFFSNFMWETDEFNTQAYFSLSMSLRSGWQLKDSNFRALHTDRWNVDFNLAGECHPFDGTYDGQGFSGDTNNYTQRSGVLLDINLEALPDYKLLISNQARTFSNMNIVFPLMEGESYASVASWYNTWVNFKGSIRYY